MVCVSFCVICIAERLVSSVICRFQGLSYSHVPECIEFSFILFIHHNIHFYFELCTYCNILDIYLSWNMNSVKYLFIWNYWIIYIVVSARPSRRSGTRRWNLSGASRIDTLYTRTHMAAKCIRSHLPVLLNDTPAIIIKKIDTHSIQGFSFFIKRYYLSQYTTQCQLRGCFICNNWFF